MATVAVVGLGYVGLPLAVAFGRRQPTIGFDINHEKVERLRAYCDSTGDSTAEQLRAASQLSYSNEPADLRQADYLIVAVPTPVDNARRPDFGLLAEASRLVGRHMKRGAVVIFESTVYPGATEEVCVPLLEEMSGLKWREGFHVGYSPERINPGDKVHRLETIVKVVAGDDAQTLERVAALYESVVEAGVHRVSGIKVAEAAKVIENTQRDINIALMNEIAIICNRLGIDTLEVLEAAGTKWNFLRFRPGLVGGHCVGVDPYYLTYKAETIGYHPEVILAGRRINDSMGKYVAEQTVKQMIAAGSSIKGARVTVLGLTFKEDCPDLRNSRVADIVRELKSYGVEVAVHDPVADAGAARHEYGIELTAWDALPQAQALILAVAHDAYRAMVASDFLARLAPRGCLVDVKGLLDPAPFRAAGVAVWRL